METKASGFVPYELLTPGFEAVYTGEKRTEPDQEADKDGNVYGRWSVWTWRQEASEWDERIGRIVRQGAVDHIEVAVRGGIAGKIYRVPVRAE